MTRPKLSAAVGHPLVRDLDIVDLHVHAGPDLLRRRHSVLAAARHAQQMRAWIVVKSHLTSTCAAAWEARQEGLPASGSIVLNPIAGGMTTTAIEQSIYAHGTDCAARIIAYLPTMRHAGAHSSESLRALHHPGFTRQRWSITTILDDEAERRRLREVLRVVRDHDLIVATGHSSREETLQLIDMAESLGVPRLVITHALHPMSGFSLADIAEVADHPAVWVEITALAVLLGRHPKALIGQAASVNPRVLLSSDLGQPEQPCLPSGWALVADWLDSATFNALAAVNPSRLLFRDHYQ